MAEVVELVRVVQARDHRQKLVEALEELQVVVDLALSRLHESRRWSGTYLALERLPELAALARTAADELGVIAADKSAEGRLNS